MLPRKILAALAVAACTLLGGCMIAEVAAAPLVVPLMYFGDDPQRFHQANLTTNLLDKPGVYRLFAVDPQTPAATVSVRRDLSVRFAAGGCVLEGTRDRDATRQVPSGTWPQGRVYRVTAAEGDCAAAGSGRRMLMRPALNLTPPAQARNFPLGNRFDVSLWVDPCCATGQLIPPLPSIARIEAMPPAP